MWIDTLWQILGNTWHYLLEASPWLLLGFLFAGLLKAFVPSEVLLRYLGKRNVRSILTATLVGIPLPLCSCGVIPTGVALHNQGASRASTLAFFIATPATTITAILITLGMLGWKFTLAEIMTTFVVAIVTGLLALILIKEKPVKETRPNPQTAEIFAGNENGFKERIKTTFRYGFIDMIDDIGLYIIIGLLVAGIIAALVPSSIIGQYLGGGLLALLIMALVATPIYICSTASVPFVAALVAQGMHPCAGLVFLILGPATNLSTILAIGKSMGKKTVLLYVTSIMALSIFMAYSFHLVGWL